MKKNPVVHFEIYGEDPEQLAQFYTSLFDWTIERVPDMDYRMIKTVDTDPKGTPTQPGGVNGGLMKRPMPDARGWLNYVNVESVETATERAKKLGATVARGKSPVPGMGWFAVLLDPQGNHFAVWQTDAKAG
jgi:predicted enzyme related to lactoylglutathione lyase